MKNKSENLEFQESANEISEQQETQVAGGKKVRILLDGEPHDMEFLEEDFVPTAATAVPIKYVPESIGVEKMSEAVKEKEELFKKLYPELFKKMYPKQEK